MNWSLVANGLEQHVICRIIPVTAPTKMTAVRVREHLSEGEQGD